MGSTSDLVFKEAPAIVGGREFLSDNGKLENGSRPAPYGGNNFQARYAVRHPWTGPIDCKEPRRGIWGGPPGGGGMQTKGAPKLNLVPRTAKADLASFVKSDIPEVGFTAAKATGLPNAAPVDPSAPQAKKGCAGCAVVPVEDPSGFAALLAGVAAVLAFTSRRRGAR